MNLWEDLVKQQAEQERLKEIEFSLLSLLWETEANKGE